MEKETQAQKEKHAHERVKELKAFYVNLVSYLVMNVILIIINYVTSPGSWWFYWVTIFWGIAVLLHAVSVFITGGKLGRDWERKKEEEILKKEQE